VYRTQTISDPDYGRQFLRNGGLLSRHRAFVAPIMFTTRGDNLGNAVSSRFFVWKMEGQRENYRRAENAAQD
jgi:hypothetical protein